MSSAGEKIVYFLDTKEAQSSDYILHAHTNMAVLGMRMRCLFLQPSLPQAVNSFHGPRLACTFWKSVPFLWKQAGCQGDRDEREAGRAAWFWQAQGMDAGSPMDASPKMLGECQATRRSEERV